MVVLSTLKEAYRDDVAKVGEDFVTRKSATYWLKFIGKTACRLYFPYFTRCPCPVVNGFIKRLELFYKLQTLNQHVHITLFGQSAAFLSGCWSDEDDNPFSFSSPHPFHFYFAFLVLVIDLENYFIFSMSLSLLLPFSL